MIKGIIEKFLGIKYLKNALNATSTIEILKSGYSNIMILVGVIMIILGLILTLTSFREISFVI